MAVAVAAAVAVGVVIVVVAETVVVVVVVLVVLVVVVVVNVGVRVGGRGVSGVVVPGRSRRRGIVVVVTQCRRDRVPHENDQRASATNICSTPNLEETVNAINPKTPCILNPEP